MWGIPHLRIGVLPLRTLLKAVAKRYPYQHSPSMAYPMLCSHETSQGILPRTQPQSNVS